MMNPGSLFTAVNQIPGFHIYMTQFVVQMDHPATVGLP